MLSPWNRFCNIRFTFVVFFKNILMKGSFGFLQVKVGKNKGYEVYFRDW